MAAMIIAIAVVGFLRFVIGGNEDTWICTDGQWVKHGNPSAPKPTTGCGTQQQSCATITDQSACEGRTDCLPVYECACTTDQARAERCGGTSTLICDCYGNGFERCEALVCDANANQSVTNINSTTRTNVNTSASTEDSDATIANIESLIQSELPGTNNEGLPYYQWSLVDERMTADVEYFVVIRYNADTYGVAGDYKEKMRQEKGEIIQKAAAIFKNIMALGYPIGVIQFEAYTSVSSPNAKYQVRIEGEQIAQVDWTEDATTLAADVLPSVWTEMINGYALLDANTNG